MHEMTCEYSNDRLSVLNNTDWLVLVDVMTVRLYDPWKNSGSETEVQLGMALACLFTKQTHI